MELLGKLALGFFVGLLCGIIPLVYCIIKKMKLFSIVGISATVISGIIFSALDKSPFSAIVVAILFVLVIVVKNKQAEKETDNKNISDDDDDGDYF